MRLVIEHGVATYHPSADEAWSIVSIDDMVVDDITLLLHKLMG